MAAPKTHTEEPDHDTNAEIRRLCKEHGLTRRRFYDITQLSNELSVIQFYEALRGASITPETLAAIDHALLTFRDWLHVHSTSVDPQQGVKLLHADYLAVGRRIRSLAKQLKVPLAGRPTYEDD